MEKFTKSCVRDIVYLKGNSKYTCTRMDGLPKTFLQCFEIPEKEMIKVTLTQLQPSVTTPLIIPSLFRSCLSSPPDQKPPKCPQWLISMTRKKLPQSDLIKTKLDFSIWSLDTCGPWANTCHPAEQVNRFLTLWSSDSKWPLNPQILSFLANWYAEKKAYCCTRGTRVLCGKSFASPKWEAVAPLG